MTATTRRTSATRVLTPMWVISLFVSLTEVVLGVAVTQTTGGIQTALTCFVIVFPLLIAGSFFTTLWRKPYVLYHPSEYGGTADVNTYVEAMQRKPLNEPLLDIQIQETVRSTLLSEEVIAQLSRGITSSTTKPVEVEVTHVLESVADKTVDRIMEVGFLALDSRPIFGARGNLWRVPYGHPENVQDLLDDVWYRLHKLKDPDIPPCTYGTVWVLRNASSQHVFNELGGQDVGTGFRWRDLRTLEEVGIVPGMTLEVVPAAR